MEKNLKSITSMQRKGLDICFDQTQRTHVVAVFLDADSQKNKLVSIPCVGVTVNGYAYDFTTDSYVVECVDWLVLGFIRNRVTDAVIGNEANFDSAMNVFQVAEQALLECCRAPFDVICRVTCLLFRF